MTNPLDNQNTPQQAVDLSELARLIGLQFLQTMSLVGVYFDITADRAAESVQAAEPTVENLPEDKQ